MSMQLLADRLIDLASHDSRWSEVSKWSSSKVSKIETGQQMPSREEVELWAEATDVSVSTLEKWQKLRDDTVSQLSVLRQRPITREMENEELNRLRQELESMIVDAAANYTAQRQRMRLSALVEPPRYQEAYLLSIKYGERWDTLIRVWQLLTGDVWNGESKSPV